MRAILINPLDRSIKEIDTDGKLESLQALVDGYIEGVYPGEFVPELEGVHGYCNEEFLYKHPEWRARPFALTEAYPYLCGPVVLLGSARGGNEGPCPASLETVARHVVWRF